MLCTEELLTCVGHPSPSCLLKAKYVYYSTIKFISVWLLFLSHMLWLFLLTGLLCLKSLQILHLSYNQISAIGASDLTNSTSLKELHLHHNHIRNIHSHAFIDLKQLEVIKTVTFLFYFMKFYVFVSVCHLVALGQFGIYFIFLKNTE